MRLNGGCELGMEQEDGRILDVYFAVLSVCSQLGLLYSSAAGSAKGVIAEMACKMNLT